MQILSQILQVYICNFVQNRKATLGWVHDSIEMSSILPYLTPLTLRPPLLTPFAASVHNNEKRSFSPSTPMTPWPTPLTLLLQRSSLSYLGVNHPKATAALLTALKTILSYISSWQSPARIYNSNLNSPKWQYSLPYNFCVSQDPSLALVTLYLHQATSTTSIDSPIPALI